MLKKRLFLAGLFIILSACVISSPAEIFSSTPTICVECVQATICAENASGDACVIDTPSAQVDVLPTLIPSTDELPATEVVTEDPLLSDTVEATPTEKAALPFPATMVNAASENPSVSATRTNTEVPTQTPSRTRIASLTPSRTPTRTATPEAWIYGPQTGSPKYTKNFAHPESACTWSGIAGQVFGPGGAPQDDVVVIVNGNSNGTPIDLIGFTGASVAYGPGAFEVEFPVGPVRTYDSIKIQLFDLEGNELSGAISFDTYTECTKNLIVFNFVMAK